jgi:putative membrane protein
MKLIIGWLINAGVLLLMPRLLSGVQVTDFPSALIAALVIGLLNMFLKPLLVLLTLPINVLTLGLFTIVINGFLFWLASYALQGFQITGFGWAIVTAIVYSLVTWAIRAVVLRQNA